MRTPSDQPEILSNPSRVGEVLGERWRLVERLGGGGMGEVYRAVHLNLGRIVAIKVLRPEHGRHPAHTRRVFREGQAASRVTHPNVVRIEDVGVDARGLPYLVQEFLDGIDLDAYAQKWRGVVPSRELLPLMIPALDALGALHEAGILHRDLKPSNVFLVRDGQRWSPRLLDFGLATMNEPGEDNVRITGSAVTLGSPAYMSPEQFRDPRALTPRSDLWSFGVMLYELLSGVLPFAGATVGAVAIAASTETPVHISQRVPSLAPALSDLVMRCLEKDPARRPATVHEMIRACTEAQSVLPPPVSLDALLEGTASGPVPRLDPSLFEPTQPNIALPERTPASIVLPTEPAPQAAVVARSEPAPAPAPPEPAVVERAPSPEPAPPSPWPRAVALVVVATLVVAAVVGLSRRPSPVVVPPVVRPEPVVRPPAPLVAPSPPAPVAPVSPRLPVVTVTEVVRPPAHPAAIHSHGALAVDAGTRAVVTAPAPPPTPVVAPPAPAPTGIPNDPDYR